MKFFGSQIRPGIFFLGLFESIVFILAFLWVNSALFGAGSPTLTNSFEISEMMSGVIFPSLVLFTVLMLLGAYKVDARNTIAVMAQRLIVGAAVGLLAIVVLQETALNISVPAWKLSLAVGGSLLVIFVGRIAFRAVAAANGEVRNVLFLGSGEIAHDLWQLAKSSKIKTVYGFVPLNAKDKQSLQVPENECVKLDSALADYAGRHGLSEVVIAVDPVERDLLPIDELIECRMRGISVMDSPSYVERETGKVDLENLTPNWLIFSPGFRRTAFADGTKRFTDIFFSFTALAIAAPLMLVIALLIKLDSRGPVFYRQTRIGLDGKPFDIFKFRSMRTDAESDGRARWATKNDNRVTRIGKFIRLTRIDEIPQFINVLKGDMAVVGPRPERPVFVDELNDVIPFYADRHRVKPGITGWAQVNYPYGASVDDAREKLKFDLYYIKNYSPLLDIQIVFRTFPIIVFFQGAR